MHLADAAWCHWMVSTDKSDDHTEFCHLKPSKCRASCQDVQTRNIVESRVQPTQSVFNDPSWRPSPDSAMTDYWKLDLDELAKRASA